jgi:ABC-type multidrug transport system fused ATPase/permease subunit
MSLLLAMLFFLVCSETSLAGSRIWLAHWSTSNITDSSEQNNYVGIYGALGVGQGFFLFLVTMTLAHVCVNGATVLHEKLLGNIMRLPLAFFETTPLGRIVNRFSKDIDVIDTMIPRNLSSFFQTSVAILGTVFLICYSTPIFMTVMIPLAVLYVLIQVSVF